MKHKVGTIYAEPVNGDLYILARVMDGSRQIGYTALPITVDYNACWDTPARLASDAVSGLQPIGSSFELPTLMTDAQRVTKT